MLIISPKLVWAEVKANLSMEGETLNFELSGKRNWDYDLKRIKVGDQTKVQLHLKSIDRSELSLIPDVKNPFVTSVQVLSEQIDNRWVVEFVLKNPRVETFDYLTDQPSKLIIDFYESDEAIAAIEESSSANYGDVKKNINSKNFSEKKSTNKIDRSPADFEFLKITQDEKKNGGLLSRSGLFDAGDTQFKRFGMMESDFKEEAIIKSRSNYYLKFPFLDTEFLFWKKMKENPPEYDISASESTENKQARLLKTLFTKKRFLVFLQTQDWFSRKYPQSQYSEMLAYMKGDALIELYRELKDVKFYEEAQNAYRRALEKYPDSVLAERTSLMTGLLANDRADYMSAVRRLNIHIENKKYATKISRNYAKLALAYSFSKMKRLDEALNILNDVLRESKDPVVQAELAVRRGDFYFFNGKLIEAITAYEQAAKDFPIVAKNYPSAFFNKMEAQFWRSQFKNSHSSALEFAQNFPSHSFAPYALTRVGELLEIMGADPAKSLGAYLETHFRYGDSPKTIIAKLHLLSDRMKSMKPEELEITLKKMNELAAKSELENIDQFKVAKMADGYSKRKEFIKAIDILSSFYQSNPNRPDVKQVTQRIVTNISDELKRLSDNSNYRDLLKIYKKFADTWLKTDRRVDTDYFLGLAYENAGAYAAALDKYQKLYAELGKIIGSKYEKEMYVNQYLPTLDSLQLRLAVSQFENGNPQEAYAALEKIQRPADLSEPDQIERVHLAAKLYDAKGEHLTAIRYLSELSNLWSGDIKLSLPVHFALAEKQIHHGQMDAAISTFEKAKKIIVSDKEPKESDVVKLLNSYSKILIDEKKNQDAINVLSSVLEKFDKFSLSQERYLLGDLLFKNGDIKKAENVWAKIPEGNDNVWKKLSNEKLKQASWDVNYKKHIKRIPAMSKIEEEK